MERTPDRMCKVKNLVELKFRYFLVLELSLIPGSQYTRSSQKRTWCNLDVDELHFILISEPCEEGRYRDSSMTSCDKCDAGKQPNTDKSDCGKTFSMIENSRGSH